MRGARRIDWVLTMLVLAGAVALGSGVYRLVGVSRPAVSILTEVILPAIAAGLVLIGFDYAQVRAYEHRRLIVMAAVAVVGILAVWSPGFSVGLGSAVLGVLLVPRLMSL
ncbi:MAG: hypothetical protein ACYDAB_14465 [bacterium]